MPQEAALEKAKKKNKNKNKKKKGRNLGRLEDVQPLGIKWMIKGRGVRSQRAVFRQT